MELEDIYSDLQSLIKLYGLLQSSEDNLLTTTFVNLDEKAKLLLKNLLDHATERVFEAHLKIIVDGVSMSNNPCATPPEQPEASMKLQPPAPRDILKASPTVVRKPIKDLTFHADVAPKDEQSITKPTPVGKFSELEKVSIPPPERRIKRCRVCQKISNKQLNLVRDTKISNENTQSLIITCKDQDQQQQAHVRWDNKHAKRLVLKKNLVDSVENIERSGKKRTHGFECNTSAVNSSTASACNFVTGVVNPSGEHNLDGEINKKLEDVGYISEEAAEAIKQIKSRLQALQLTAEVVDPAHKGSFRNADSICIARSEMSQAGGESVGNVLPSQQMSRRRHDFKDSSPANKAVSLNQKPISGAGSSDLQSQTASRELLLKTSDQLSQLARHKGGGNRGTTTFPANSLNRVSKPTMKELNLQSRNHPAGNVKAIVQRIESLRRLRSETDHLPDQAPNYVRGLRVSSSQVNKEHKQQDVMVKNETTGCSSASTPSMLPDLSLKPADPVQHGRETRGMRSRHKQNQTQARELKQNQTQARELKQRKNNHLPHDQVIMRPTLLDRSSSKVTMQPILYKDQMEDRRKRSGVHKNVLVRPRNRILARQQVSEDTASSSYDSSSSWTSQQTSSNSSSESDSSWISQQTSTSYSESERYLPPNHQRGVRVVGFPSRSVGRFASASSSSEESSSFLHGSESDYYPTKTSKLEGRMKPEKRIGRFRRLKNKLGLVFHHHHHHHHHHNSDDMDHAEVDNAMSLWTHVRKIFHHSNKNKVYNDDDDDDDDDDAGVKNSKKKSAVSKVPSKNQHGHFHALVEGLMRHVRHSKKSKPSKNGGIRRLRHEQNKKVVKKLHWWQMLKKRKRGVKLSNKGRVKLGYRSKKPQLRAGKMI